MVWFGLVFAAHAADDVGALDWLAGCWATEGARTEECWLASADGLMIGMNRARFECRPPFFEFLRIEVVDGQVTYLASPKGGAPVAFPQVEVGRNRVVFENPAHDFPQRIVYERAGKVLEATVSAGERRSSWTFRRVRSR